MGSAESALPGALAPAPSLAGRPPRPSGSGRRAGPGRERIITMVNTHETVASTGLDNSHDDCGHSHGVKHL